MFLYKCERFDAVFALADKVDVGKTLQQVSQFVARGFLVIDDQSVDGHTRLSVCVGRASSLSLLILLAVTKTDRLEACPTCALT